MSSLFPISNDFTSFLDSANQPDVYSLSFPSVKGLRINKTVLMGLVQNTLINLVLDGCEYYYGFNSKINSSQWLIAITEAVNNSYIHNNSGTVIDTGLLFGDKGLGFGINDGGDFFKRRDVLSMIKHEVEPSKNNRSPFYNSGFKGGHGFSRYYRWVDFIDVDISLGTLYLGFSKDKILIKRQ